MLFLKEMVIIYPLDFEIFLYYKFFIKRRLIETGQGGKVQNSDCAGDRLQRRDHLRFCLAGAFDKVTQIHE
jgi:hypothetical protein